MCQQQEALQGSGLAVGVGLKSSKYYFPLLVQQMPEKYSKDWDAMWLNAAGGMTELCIENCFFLANIVASVLSPSSEKAAPGIPVKLWS